MKSEYWAEFVKIGTDTFRFDTRIYLNPVDNVTHKHHCIGAVVGKNPGSAKSAAISKGLQPIELDGDKLLPTVRNMIKDSYQLAGIEIPKNGYIQILNLFYLCNKDLSKAIPRINSNNADQNCPTENQEIPWVWYAWGNGECKKTSKTLNRFKSRFDKLKSNNQFYLDKNTQKVVASPATEKVFAQHLQGLKGDYVKPYISELLKKLKSEQRLPS